MQAYLHELKPVRSKKKFIGAENQYVVLMPIGDIHYLSKGWPEKKFIDHIKWGCDHGATFLGMGDYFDFAATSQRKAMGPLRDDVLEQISDLVTEKVNRFFELIAFSRGRWIGLLEGNHRWEFPNGKTADQLLCKLLDCDFLGTSALFQLASSATAKCPEARPTIFVHHGRSAARGQGAQLNPIENAIKSFDADVYLMAHTHCKPVAPLDRLEFSNDGVFYNRTLVIGRTGSFMRGYHNSAPLSLELPACDSRGTYVEERLLPPATLGGSVISIGYKQIEGSSCYRPTIKVMV